MGVEACPGSEQNTATERPGQFHPCPNYRASPSSPANTSSPFFSPHHTRLLLHPLLSAGLATHPPTANYGGRGGGGRRPATLAAADAGGGARSATPGAWRRCTGAAREVEIVARHARTPHTKAAKSSSSPTPRIVVNGGRGLWGGSRPHTRCSCPARGTAGICDAGSVLSRWRPGTAVCCQAAQAAGWIGWGWVGWDEKRRSHTAAAHLHHITPAVVTAALRARRRHRVQLIARGWQGQR